MFKLRIFTGPAFILAAAAMHLVSAPLFAGDNEDALARAIALFDQGEYLAAQETLVGVDRGSLSAKDQGKRDEYLNRIQVAITMEDKALRDVEDAETAIEDGDKARGRELLNAVLANPYAPESLQRVARNRLRDLGSGNTATMSPTSQKSPATEKSSAAQRSPATMNNTASARVVNQDEPPAAAAMTQNGADATARASKLTEEGDGHVAAGRYDQAEQAYNAALNEVPGYPEAVQGLNKLRALQGETGRDRSLADQIRAEDAINWQRTVTQYRDVEKTILQEVAAERFEEARQLLIRAQQIVESGKQFADPVVKYENLRSEVSALAEHVDSSERAYNEEQLATTRMAIEQQRSKRIQEIEVRRTEQVDLLMEQANQHRKDGDFVKAMNVLRQVSVVDPKYRPARWMLDQIEDEFQYRRQRDMRKQYYDLSVDALNDVEEAKIPWWQDVNYPDNWPELIARPERQRPGQDGRDNLLLGSLDRPIEADFNREPFRQVIERLAQTENINIIVNWHDLNTAGIQDDVPIDLNLPKQISMKKALTEILGQAGAGVVNLGMEVSDGAVSIATQHTLDTKTYVAVYPISDLLMDIPTYNGAPTPDLRSSVNETPSANDRQPILWQHGDDDGDDWEEDPAVRSKINSLIDLIKDTVAPESWRDRGGTIGTVREMNQQLVVTQNSASQREIGGLLDKLREQRAIQIAVEAIFLTVSSHYLEELGMDLDIILNSGNAGLDFIDGGGFAATDPVLGSRALLPRTFSRTGFTPAVPPLGNANILNPAAGIPQPYGYPALVPPSAGGSGSQWTPVPILSNVTDFTDPSRLPGDIPGSFAGQTIGPALSIMGSFLDNIQVDFMIRATQADSRTTVLTAPRLVVFNGGSAWVAVTIQQNYVSQLQPVVAQQAVAQAPITGVIDAGASLFVRGTVTTDRRYVMLLLAPGLTRLLDIQVFPFSGGTGALAAFIQLPTLSSQRIQTMVSVPDGGTLLIGGQKLASETEIEAGVPILSKIPVLKRAYSARTTVKDEQTLLILIKPKILIHSEQEELAFPSFSRG
ncbi:MAG: hypothetical protein ACYTHJ_09015 [Planctomycetota bacterium]